MVRFAHRLLGLTLAAMVAMPLGCGSSRKKPSDGKPTVKMVYDTLPPAANLPDFMKGTLHELAVTIDTDAQIVSGYGLVAGLRNTGDSDVPMIIREYILRDMMKRGIPKAESILNDKRVAIVQVEGIMPPGIRRGEQFDVQVSAIAGSHVSSLAHGRLFQCDLSINGANELRPGNPVANLARAQGEIFVNPAYALSGPPDPSSQAAASLRMGIVMNGAQAMADRPMRLRLRSPQFSMARFVENRIDSKFQNRDIAAAENEAIVHFVVPSAYAGDWEHFRQLVTHLYVDARPEIVPVLGSRLVAAARKPDAPLLDVSYCLEGLGEAAGPYVDELLTDGNPAVVYAAARAGAFVQHQGSIYTLMEIARTEGHPFQVSAVQNLGKLPPSPMIASRLRQLVNSDQQLVRIEAYKTLARHKDPTILSRVVEERFVLDIVPGDGPPLIYATRSGVPRIAIIGTRAKVEMPLTFTALANQFMISSNLSDRTLTLYYRGEDVRKPVKMLSSPDLPELIARLGGDGGEDETRLNFSYSEILGMLESLATQGKIIASATDGQRLPAAVYLQEMPGYVASAVASAARPAEDATTAVMTADQLPDLTPDAAGDAALSESNSKSRPR